jgi:hypothetical protein
MGNEFGMILFAWAIIFMVALVPAALVGGLVGKLPLSAVSCGLLLAGGAALSGLVASQKTYQSSALSINLTIFFPPIILPMLLGLRISRAKRKPPSRPWHLPPENLD